MENYCLDISIIVLIHDVSSYIEKCLKSINNQDFDKPYEVLLLMDAATQDDYAAVEPFLLFY